MAQTATPNESHRLRVLVATELERRLDELAAIVRRLGHEVVATEASVEDAAALTREHHPDVAVVGVGTSSGHALALISRIVRESACPVVVVLPSLDPEFVDQAARRGVFAYVTHDSPAALESAIEIVLHRFSEFRSLDGAFGRRAMIERAKGILMERHRTSERAAFELLRSRARSSGRKVSDIAHAIEESHLLLPAQRTTARPDPQSTD